jgi:isocitrate dehydrogenase
MTMHNPPYPPLLKGGRGDLEDELKMAYKISLIRGDGIGPEITEATLKVIEVTTED